MRGLRRLIGLLAFTLLSGIALAASPLDGTSWRVDLFLGRSTTPTRDRFRFENGTFTSSFFKQKGYQQARFTPKEQKDGLLVWETLQPGKGSFSISWHGEVEGATMRGVASVIGAEGRVNLVFVAHKMKAGETVEETAVAPAPAAPSQPSAATPEPKAKPKPKKTPPTSPPPAAP